MVYKYKVYCMSFSEDVTEISFADTFYDIEEEEDL